MRPGVCGVEAAVPHRVRRDAAFQLATSFRRAGDASERSVEFRAEVFVMPVVDEVRLGVSGE
jgi:hypothetical protein